MFALKRLCCVSVFAWTTFVLLSLAAPAAEPAKSWYKGETHAHSFWSDGDQFPEMVLDWYKAQGFQFVALSDHNVYLEGERWRDVNDPKRLIPAAVLQKYRERFGADWVETRGEGETLQVRLKTLEEIRPQLEEPGKFLLIPNEEISDGAQGSAIHINAIGLGEVIPPQHGSTVAETIQNNFQAIDVQAQRRGRLILGQVNHPNWVHFDIRAEDILAVPAVRLFEVCNNHAGVNYFGDDLFPSADRLWDVLNAVRIVEQKRPPLFGVASDDAHNYHSFQPGMSNPGRGWVVVRAAELTPEAITQAMAQGDFYSSTGVVLRDVQFDAASGTLSIAIDGKPGAKYTTRFLGTRKDFDRSVEEIPAPDFNGKPQRPFQKHSDQIGTVLATVEGTTASYTLQGDELYVRAVITSDQPVEFPVQNHPQTGMAWSQPYGWQKWLAK